MVNLYGRPSQTRGFLPLLAAAMGIGRATIGAIQANQTKQRNKGYINDAYRRSKRNLDTTQGNARQSIAEAMGARGLSQGGDISASTTPTTKDKDGNITANQGATTLGGQVESNAGVQMAIEQDDLTNQRDTALKENKAEYNNALVNSLASGAQTAASTFSSGQDLAAAGGPPAASRSSIHAAMLSGSAYDGVHPNDPLGEPSSAWSTHPPPSVLADPGQSNASFNVG